MIVAKKSVKEFILNQLSMTEFAEKIGLTRQTLYNVLNGENLSADVIAKLLLQTGFDFEKAFEFTDEVKKGE